MACTNKGKKAKREKKKTCVCDTSSKAFKRRVAEARKRAEELCDAYDQIRLFKWATGY